jgi:long-chain acyl-CoA synthetase
MGKLDGRPAASIHVPTHASSSRGLAGRDGPRDPWEKAPVNLASLSERNLAEFGEYERLVFEGRSYTNRDLALQSARLATGLEALGLVADDKVVVMMANGPEVFVAYEGIWRAGLVAIPVLFLLDARELRYILDDSGAKAVVTSPEVYEKVAQATDGIGRKVHVLVTGPRASVPPGSLCFDETVERSAPRHDIAVRDEEAIATILYTSGTTGRPKGVMQTHHNLLANAHNAWNTSKSRVRGETSVVVLPLAHSFGLGALVSGYLFGGRAILMRWFNPEGALELIQRYRAKGMAGVPTMFVLMLMHPNAGLYDTSSVTRWVVGAAPMPAAQLEAFEKKFGGVMYVGYGLTESCPGVAVEREGAPRKPGSTGQPMEGVTVRIVDDEENELPRGEVGEIIVRGENVSPGYYKNPQATAETFRGGWLFTGDLGYLDADDYLFVVERKKDLIIRGGLNIYPKDVEEVIHRLEGVREVAVVGVPDAVMGEEVCAYVAWKAPVATTPEQVIAHCQAHLAKYKSPKYVEFLPSLPKTGLGKIQKKEVRKLAVARFGRPRT